MPSPKKIILSFEEDLVIAVKNAPFVVSHPSSALVESSAIGAPTFVLKESLNGYFEGIEKCSLSDLCGLGGVNDNNKKSMDGEDINLVENIDAFIRLCSSGSANCSKMSRHELSSISKGLFALLISLRSLDSAFKCNIPSRERCRCCT